MPCDRACSCRYIDLGALFFVCVYTCVDLCHCHSYFSYALCVFSILHTSFPCPLVFITYTLHPLLIQCVNVTHPIDYLEAYP